MRKRRALVAVVGAALSGLLAMARVSQRWFPVRVEGESMSPTLSAGEWLAVRPLRPGEPVPGQIVVVRARGLEMVKRVVSGDASPGYWVEGDNPSRSTDSRSFGAVPREAVAGVVRARYRPLRAMRLFDR